MKKKISFPCCTLVACGDTDERDLVALSNSMGFYNVFDDLQRERFACGRVAGEVELDLFGAGNRRYAVFQERAGSRTLYVKRV